VCSWQWKTNAPFPFLQTAITLMRLVHRPVQPAGAIEQGILGVQMEMDKVRVRHAGSLTSNRQDTKTQSLRWIITEGFGLGLWRRWLAPMVSFLFISL
jgi:hypothetical protein